MPLVKNIILLVASSALVLISLEIYFRIFPETEIQTNNEYKYRTLSGKKEFLVPYHSWTERYPEALDDRGYYRQSNFVVGFYFNQYGARWKEPADQPLGGKTIVLLGDSFTYGSGLRYEDTYAYQLEQLLSRSARRVSIVNFGNSGADTKRCLEIYEKVGKNVDHDIVLYGLHLNDVISFSTSYVIRNQLHDLPIINGSKFGEFVLNKINRYVLRKRKIDYLTDAARFEDTRFTENLNAMEELHEITSVSGKIFGVVILPILVDIKEGTFGPVYAEIKSRLRSNGISYFDLTGTVRDYDDSDLWILPIDQHPNEVANKRFAEYLAVALEELLKKT